MLRVSKCLSSELLLRMQSIGLRLDQSMGPLFFFFWTSCCPEKKKGAQEENGLPGVLELVEYWFCGRKAVESGFQIGLTGQMI